MLFSEPKIPQSHGEPYTRPTHRRFSALQRAENSSIPLRRPSENRAPACFSALQRAENFSISRCCATSTRTSRVSVLFSEPKIPQYPMISASADWTSAFQCSSASRKFLNSPILKANRAGNEVSVLFSEPKIPQCAHRASSSSSLQRVSVLFSEPKIPQF